MTFNANYNKTSKKNPTIKLNESKDAVFGIYLAEIVSTKDVSRTGRVRVFIPAISKDKNSTAGYFDAIWTSPFAGSTDPRKVGKDINLPEQAMSSYGFWATVPDNGNLVLVAFGDGNTKYPLVMSCLFSDKFNFMIPGNAGSKTYQAPGLELPTVEKNKRTEDINHNDTFRPIQHTLAAGIVKQGLARDPIRGAGRASARRESPSEVFGILTPGPRDPDNFNYRLGGHSITLDDNLGSRQIRIRTAQGGQILLDDTSGMIYMINRDGNVWMELAQNGDMYLHAEGDINLRAKQNFNLRADYDVNIEAGQNVNIKAARDNDGAGYAGELGGVGGDVRIQANNDMHLHAEENTFQTSSLGETHMSSAKSFYNTIGGDSHVDAAGKMLNSAGADYNLKTGGNTVLQGPGQYVAKGSVVLLNSGGPEAGAPELSRPPVKKTTVDHEDKPSDPPGYQKDDPSPVVTSGLRPGEFPTIASICTTMVTAEPFVGHGIPDPSKEDREDMIPDETISAGLNGGNGISTPPDINSPAGYSNASTDGNGNPVYSSPANITNNFTQAKSKVALTQGIGNLQSAMAATIPISRQIATTPRNNPKVGFGSEISGLSAKLQKVAFTQSGIPADLQNAQVKTISNLINSASQAYPNNPALREEALLGQGIRTIVDGASTIYIDKQGFKVVDFRNGMGNVSASMLQTAALMQTFDVVKQHINIPLSDNQMLAMVSYADHVGIENFAKSKALRALNAGLYQDVPNLLTEHSTLMQGGRPIFQEDHFQRRQFEGELFMSPDAVAIPEFDHRVTFAEQAQELRRQRRQLLLS